VDGNTRRAGGAEGGPRRSEPTGPGPLPTTAEAITPGWLGEVLGSSGPRVAAVEVAGAHSGTTGRAMLRVRWEPPDAGLPERIFAKLPPDDAIQRQMVAATDMGRREARFYADLARAVPVRVPAPLWAGWGPDSSQYLMLLEDLAASGCDFPTAADPGLLDFTRAVVEELARLHARFADWPRFAASHPWVAGAMRNEWGRLLVQAGLDAYRDGMPPEFAAIGELYVAHMEAINDWLDRGPHTLVHGDCHLGNLFRDRSRPGFLDWACTSHAPGLRDVAYFLCNSIPVEMRRKEERDLLARYREALRAAGAAVAPLDATWRDYRRLSLTSWVAATATAAAASRMQPIEVGLRAMKRTNAAAADLELVPLLREALGVG
jgi:aminoglycoside phosphotransferase (APT) family kinase protein